MKTLPECVLITLWLTEAASATDVAFHKKILESGMTAVIICNEKINETMKIVMWLEESGLLMKGVSETIKNEVKEQKRGFLGILLGILVASLLWIHVKAHLEQVNRLLGQVSNFSVASSLINFEIQKNHQNESKFNGIFSRNNSPRIKDM